MLEVILLLYSLYNLCIPFTSCSDDMVMKFVTHFALVVCGWQRMHGRKAIMQASLSTIADRLNPMISLSLLASKCVDGLSGSSATP